jgi:hypothetical protein
MCPLLTRKPSFDWLIANHRFGSRAADRSQAEAGQLRSFLTTARVAGFGFWGRLLSGHSTAGEIEPDNVFAIDNGFDPLMDNRDTVRIIKYLT